MAEQLKLPEVARRLGVSEKTARRYVKAGALPSVFVGGAYRVSEEDLEEYLQDARVTPGGDPPKEPALPSPQRSFNDVLEEERREREKLLIGLMRTFVERGEELEDLFKMAEGIPFREADVYAQGSLALHGFYEEMASKGRVSEELEEARAQLVALDTRINGLLGQFIDPGDAEQARRLEAFRRARRQAAVTRGEEAGDEANAVNEAR